MLAMLLAARHEDGSPMSKQEVRDELMTLLVAGHETTASELAWAFERLARTPDVLRPLTDEIDAGDDDAYLTATVQEILRLKPVVPIIPRLVMRPIEIGGVRYPPGVRLFGIPYLVHTDPSVYEDPYAFRPERFLEKAPTTYTWVPFGGGRRRCLGNVVAQAEIKCALREVLRRYDLSPERPQTEPPRASTVVLYPGRGLRMAVSDRSH